MGVREDAQYDLAEDIEVWQYVPYGRHWKRWFVKRAKNNARFAARAAAGAVGGPRLGA